ncbi:hypothetical protein RHGRI_034463 [Rhododendron griersonianum]|uniref:Uncharacterized protein n=1 Tax=Rhododendron griersonianum TaxID=479676 RepID=A0AAV6I5B2_9ERIC|nr:hypothetical protein RHGRI_034463 [Rhododendron griersonianum]
MDFQLACCGISTPNAKLPSAQRFLSPRTVPRSLSVLLSTSRSHVGFKDRRLWVQNASKTFLGLKRTSYKGVIVCAAESNSEANLKFSEEEEVEMCVDEVEPFRGKSGSVSFRGSTHQLVEEGKWASSPSKEETGSLLWVLAPVALISSIVLPQLLLSTVIDVFIKDEILLEVAASFCSEVSFYIGLAIFLLVADHVQKPYIQFSPKRWGLITGLRGYMTSAFLAMGLKVVASLLAVYVTWPALGLPALVAVAPFLAGCLVQLVFEAHLNRRGSSCWPLVPIIFEDVKAAPGVVERGGAMVAMVATFQILGFVCLWSLLTFLLSPHKHQKQREKLASFPYGGGGGGSGGVAAVPTGGAAPASEAMKEEKVDMIFSLFD